MGKRQRTNDNGPRTFSSDSELIRLFERGSALAADDRRAIAAHQGVVDFTAARRAVERAVFGLLAVTHPFTFLRAEPSSLTPVNRNPYTSTASFLLSRLINSPARRIRLAEPKRSYSL